MMNYPFHQIDIALRQFLSCEFYGLRHLAKTSQFS